MSTSKALQNTHENDALEVECAKLEQKCRQIEREKKRMIESSRALFYKYRKEIDVLEAENYDLKLQISLVNCYMGQKRDAKHIAKLRDLVLLYDRTRKHIEKERRRHVEIDYQIHHLREKYNELLRASKSKYDQRLKVREKSKSCVEDHLQKQYIKLDSTFIKIGAIRKDVETMYIQRRLFVGRWKKLIYENEKISREKLRLIDLALGAQEEREKIIKKVRLASAKNANDRILLETELKDRQRQNIYLESLQLFLKMKCKSRRKHAVLPQSAEDQATKCEAEISKLELYEETFRKLQELLSATEVVKIIEIFNSRESEINRAVKYINAKNSDCSRIMEDIDQLKEEKRRTLVDSKAAIERFRDKILQLDSRYSKVKAEFDALSESLRKLRAIAKHVLREIGVLSSITFCSNSEESCVDALMPHVVDRTMSALEYRIGQLCLIYKMKKRQSSVDGHDVTEPMETATLRQTDSVLSEEICDPSESEDLPSVGDGFDQTSVDSGIISQLICDEELRKMIF